MDYSKKDLIKLCDELLDWALKDQVVSFMQFYLTDFAVNKKLTKKKVDLLAKEHSFIEDTFFYCKCIFVDKILKDKHLQETVPRGSLLRYLRMHDEYLKESEQTENLERNIALGVATLFCEDYSKEKIEEDFAHIHAKNLAKRNKTMNPNTSKDEKKLNEYRAKNV